MSFKPSGYNSVLPYLIVDGADRTIAFLDRAFGATLIRRIPAADGGVMHAEVRIDDSVLMLTDGGPGHPPMAANVYVYVRDVDAAYDAALAAGGVSVQAPAQKDDDDKRGGVRDPGGVTWWMATRVGRRG